jgi:hypothetical protein
MIVTELERGFGHSFSRSGLVYGVRELKSTYPFLIPTSLIAG